MSNALLMADLKHKEKSEFSLDINNYMWNKMNVQGYNPKNCTKTCKDRFSCYYLKLRDTLQITNGIIVCNQNLLTMNQLKKARDQKRLLPTDIPIIIIDEAHNLESIVRNTLTESYNRYDIKDIIRQAVQVVNSNWINLNTYIEKLDPIIDDFFSNINDQIKNQIESSIRGREIEHYFVHNNIPKLSMLVETLNAMTDKAEINYGTDDWNHKKSDDTIIDNLMNLNGFFQSFFQTESNDIFWAESNNDKITVFRCPKNMKQEIYNLYFSDSKTKTVLTSATICTQNEGNPEDRYKYFTNDIGFPVGKGIGYLADPKESPFDYDRHALIFYTDELPHPIKERDNFIEKGTELIIDLLNITKGKALILFTAKTDLDLVYDKLKDRLPYKIIKQNTDSSQSSSISQFKNDTNSVLLGVGTFWEGISVEGEALSNLIIFRLPFSVPDPIVTYKCSQCNDPLMEVLVPEMILKLKQGIGRLIRNKTDKGIVSILDPRLGDKSTAKYKEQVWNALPIKNKTNDINKLRIFYNNLFR